MRTTLWCDSKPSIPWPCAAAIIVLVTACGGSDAPTAPDAGVRPDAAPPPPVTPIYQPPAPGAGADWGTIPYPNDLFLDSSGHMKLTSLPTGANPDSTAIDMLTEALAVMDGAGVNSHAYFPMSANVDNTSLAGNVKIVDLDDSLAEVAVDVLYRSEIGAIMAAPVRGTLLEENHRYAAYITTGVKSDDGRSIAASEAFAAVLDLNTVPEDANLAAAQESLRPLLAALDSEIVASLASATVFRTQHTTEDLLDMFTVARAITPSLTGSIDIFGPDAQTLDLVFGGAQDPSAPPGADDTDRRAQPHSHVAAVVHAEIPVPSFRSTEPLSAGMMERDTSGVPIVKSSASVRFTLTLPKGVASYENLPVLLWIHGINQSRADMLLFTDEVNRRGYAYVGMDLLYHGDRRPNARDTKINIMEAPCVDENGVPSGPPCDGIGDTAGLIPATQLFHLSPSGGVPAYHPRAIMENLRQTAIDLVAMNNFLSDGDLSPLVTALRSAGVLAADQNLSFRGDDIGILTESLGAMAAVLLAAVDARVKIAFLASPANSFPYPLLYHSAAFSNTFAPITLRPWDVADRTTVADPIKGARNEPIVMLWNSVIERGDAAAFSRAMVRGDLRPDSGIHLMVTQTWQDEWVSNTAVEHLVGVMGLPMMRINRALTPPGPLFRFVPSLQEQDGPIMGNADGGNLTQVATLWYPAAHALLRKLEDYYDYEPELVPVAVGQVPFTARDQTWYFCNPVRNIHVFWGDFFDAHFAGQVPAAVDPFPTAVPPGEPPCQ